nr:MAG: RNA-dependent RNA-polymerase [Picobirnavirus sp.]
MSCMKPLSERMSDIDSYYDLILRDQEPFLDEAFTKLFLEWSDVPRIQIRSEESTNDKMKKSTNSGSPFFTKRKSVQKKTIPCKVGENGMYVEQQLPQGKYSACAILGWRGQEGGRNKEDVKQRVVWMFPYAVNLQELRIYQPLIETFQSLNLVPAWVSMDAVDERVTRLFDTKSDSDLIICTDFSKFDQHFNKTCQDAALTILRKLVAQNAPALEWFETVFPIKYMIPLAYDWNETRFGAHGMGSGSGGTNADETLVHRLLQHEAAIKSGSKLNPNSQCLGDDGILSFPGCTVEDVIKAYSSHGLDMNQDKQYASTQDCTYLRRWHHDKYRIDGICVGVYSTNRALGRLMEQERYYDPDVWSSKMVALRQLSIIENCKYHPLREEFVQFCIKGDKYRLGLDIPGFFDNIESEAKNAIDLMPDFLGYTKNLQREANPNMDVGIGNWWVVKYLKSLA